MSREWWVPIVQWTVWGLLMAVAMGWMARSRSRARPASERCTLRHPPSTLVFGVAGAAFFFGIAVVSNTIGKNATATVWTTLLFIGFGAGSLTMVADYLFGRHRVSDRGIEYGRMLGQRGTITWSEVRSVRFAPTMKWFLLETASGTTVRVSAMLMGLPEFARLVLRHVAKEAIEPSTQAILMETLQGRPPSVWG